MFRELLLRYRQSLLLSLALLLPLASMYYHGKDRAGSSPIERSLLALTSPVTAASHDSVAGVRDLMRGYVLLTEVEARNQELERENRILLGEALRSRAQAEELERVKRLCEFRAQRKAFVTVPARVVGRDVSQFFQVIRLQIDTAGIPEVREGQAVITHDGIVGRIEKLEAGHADVMLVTDARSQVHASVPGKGVTGSVKGKGKKHEFGVQFVYLDRIDRTVPLRPGDAVLTTGHDRIFPAGLELGHIAEGAAVPNGPYHEFVLVPAVAYATLEEVLIVTGHRLPDPDPAAAVPSSAAVPQGKRVVDPANTPDAPP